MCTETKLPRWLTQNPVLLKITSVPLCTKQQQRQKRILTPSRPTKYLLFVMKWKDCVHDYSHGSKINPWHSVSQKEEHHQKPILQYCLLLLDGESHGYIFLRKIDPSSLEPCKQSQKFQLKYCHHIVKWIFVINSQPQILKKVYIFQYHHFLHFHQTIYSLIIVDVFAWRWTGWLLNLLLTLKTQNLFLR